MPIATFDPEPRWIDDLDYGRGYRQLARETRDEIAKGYRAMRRVNPPYARAVRAFVKEQSKEFEREMSVSSGPYASLNEMLDTDVNG